MGSAPWLVPKEGTTAALGTAAHYEPGALRSAHRGHCGSALRTNNSSGRKRHDVSETVATPCRLVVVGCDRWRVASRRPRPRRLRPPKLRPRQNPTAAPEPTAAPTDVPPTAVPTEAPPTAAPEPEAAPAAGKLILATTTSTADSGLLDFILPDFERRPTPKVDVIAVGTGQAIEIGSKGDADVLLVHSRKGEDQFVADGNAKERFDVMYNDFIIVGPKDDPAKISRWRLPRRTPSRRSWTRSPPSSAAATSRARTPRSWASGRSIPVTPTKEMKWYNSIGQGMGDTLLFANEQSGYTLTDRGTYLSMQDKLPNLDDPAGRQHAGREQGQVAAEPLRRAGRQPGEAPGRQRRPGRQSSWTGSSRRTRRS